ncbi:MAG: helix-turn-helix domain-containing protein, partial [Clostridia bacterium]|nr:helix-turn-helix domain-containing protein [Clostridia bacterium]
IYDPYIRKLSRIIIRTSDGEIYRVLDEDLYIILKFKLHTIIKDFKIS